MPKIFGIGLSKTGTTSLANALRIIGYAISDYPHDSETLRQLEEGDYRLKVLDDYDGMTDTPAAFCYKELDEIYKGSKFILTLRKDRKKWLQSVEEHWAYTESWRQYASPQECSFYYFMNVAMYGCDKVNRNRFSRIYEEHEIDVYHYFRKRKSDLLILDFTQGDGWSELCKFLGNAVPDEDFPHSNSRVEKMDGRRWMDHLNNVFSSIGAAVPHDSTIALVDDGVLSCTKAYTSWNCLPLVAREGVYRGNPDSDENAIRYTIDKIDEGASHLVIVEPARWWKKRYRTWIKWLECNFTLVRSDSNIDVFKLNSDI